MVHLSPVLKRKIHCAGAKVAAADADLYNRGKLLACRICNFAAVHLICQLCNLLLLLRVETALVHTVGHNCVPQLPAGHMVKHHALFAGVDHLTVVKGFEFFCKLHLLRQFCKNLQDFIVHLLRGVIECKSCRHGDIILFHTVRAVLPGHCLRKIYSRRLLQLLICRNRI